MRGRRRSRVDLADRRPRPNAIARGVSLTGKLELAGLVRSDGQGPETHRALDGADRLIVTDRGDIIAAAQASRSACVLNNSLAGFLNIAMFELAFDPPMGDLIDGVIVG